jgi:hypothetical protein
MGVRGNPTHLCALLLQYLNDTSNHSHTLCDAVLVSIPLLAAEQTSVLCVSAVDEEQVDWVVFAFDSL